MSGDEGSCKQLGNQLMQPLPDTFTLLITGLCSHLESRLMAKILITTIQVKRGEGNTNSPELSLLKFLPLTYHYSHFMTANLDFTSFFTMAFLGAAHFFYSWVRYNN